MTEQTKPRQTEKASSANQRMARGAATGRFVRQRAAKELRALREVVRAEKRRLDHVHDAILSA